MKKGRIVVKINKCSTKLIYKIAKYKNRCNIGVKKFIYTYITPMQKKYILEKCEINKLSITKEKIDVFLNNNLNKYSDENYLYWDKIKYKEVPKGIKNNKELWWFIKFMRNLNYITPISNENGEFFKFWELQFSKELLHEIDKNASGVFFTSSSETDKKMFIANWMLEEAISSSQLEWASTTTKNAKKMIKEKRKPITKDEQMIMNNYEAMSFIKDSLIKKELEKSDLLYLQSVLTKNTLEKSTEEWRYRKDTDDIIVEFEWKTAHTPPNEKVLNKELKKFIDFANNKGNSKIFVHPIIRAILIHFWIWYLHPFCDWNWRTARALFYWYLLKNDYFGFSYIPLSTVIKDSRIDYAKSYIYSEQDDLDVTYFINYNLRKIKIALKKFKKEVKERFKKNKNNLNKLRHLNLNERQKKLLNHFLEKNDNYTNATTHMNYYSISKKTSISDLKDLREKGFILSIKSWRNVNYFPIKDLETKILNLE